MDRGLWDWVVTCGTIVGSGGEVGLSKDEEDVVEEAEEEEHELEVVAPGDSAGVTMTSGGLGCVLAQRPVWRQWARWLGSPRSFSNFIFSETQYYLISTQHGIAASDLSGYLKSMLVTQRKNSDNHYGAASERPFSSFALKFVDTFEYLGRVLTKDMTGNEVIRKQSRQPMVMENALLRKFSFCTKTRAGTIYSATIIDSAGTSGCVTDRREHRIVAFSLILSYLRPSDIAAYQDRCWKWRG
ncbi:hypothetical protein E2C01_002965 [Portunus trituberculatus]|uniref:Uncharacterized protein n=1 Tax=Portunus trituberculatus TaxID=210409 RepID=A0A5B7CNB0_PORTR|nr:hypothetical protein [Portunus trituberculatus]